MYRVCHHASTSNCAELLSSKLASDDTATTVLCGKIARGRVRCTAVGAIAQDFVGAASGGSTGSVMASSIETPTANAAGCRAAGVAIGVGVIDATIRAAFVVCIDKLDEFARGRVRQTAGGGINHDFVGAAIGGSTGSIMASTFGTPTARAAALSAADVAIGVIYATIRATAVCVGRNGTWRTDGEMFLGTITSQWKRQRLGVKMVALL